MYKNGTDCIVPRIGTLFYESQEFPYMSAM